MKRAKIAFEDGKVFEGVSFGAPGERCGEVVFNTSMAGYQEILTDPSYKGQIVAMTYPLIGNYGVNRDDVESAKTFVEGFIVKELSRITSNWRSQKSLDEYLNENNIIGIEGIDTRALTRHIRLKGAMKAIISTEDRADKDLVEKAGSSPGLIGRDLVKDVTCNKTYLWSQPMAYSRSMAKKRYNVVVLDCGVKFNILRHLVSAGCKVTVVPARTGAGKILEMKPDGVLLSNGPGDPQGVPYVVNTVKSLIKKIPIFGICLGHQMLGLALGGVTYKLKFGHHGGNHPVKDLRSGRVAITVQNHGFCVDLKTLDEEDIEITHMNLNDNTLEGIRHRKYPIFSVQFHPEAGPGPHDAEYLFGEFINMMKDSV
ncbi:MAG: glutamine-hydrolyzing carbamoyl-phosphate synthase small subunit [Candidatus Omnitrophica bacterium]|nr:glutamine-hydrolyzing carbamoyl-phosphate synthase small subunit [Candidatus Omnitrophota bacterium]